MNEETAQRESEMREFGRQLGEATSQWQENFAAFEARLRQWQEVLRMRETQLHQADLSQREQLDVTAKKLRREIERVFQKQQQVSIELVLQGERLATVLAEARKRLPKPFDEAQLQVITKEESHALDAFYASFDEQFRGSREEIKERLAIYLPIIQQRGIGAESMPVLDVGCGRGDQLRRWSSFSIKPCVCCGRGAPSFSKRPIHKMCWSAVATFILIRPTAIRFPVR